MDSSSEGEDVTSPLWPDVGAGVTEGVSVMLELPIDPVGCAEVVVLPYGGVA